MFGPAEATRRTTSPGDGSGGDGGGGSGSTTGGRAGGFVAVIEGVPGVDPGGDGVLLLDRLRPTEVEELLLLEKTFLNDSLRCNFASAGRAV